jgi:hypothetical protein
LVSVVFVARRIVVGADAAVVIDDGGGGERSRRWAFDEGWDYWNETHYLQNYHFVLEVSRKNSAVESSCFGGHREPDETGLLLKKRSFPQLEEVGGVNAWGLLPS